MQNPNIPFGIICRYSYFTILRAAHFEIPCPIIVRMHENNSRTIC
jgi:hypothetical protein